jgi:hypothetical protein
MIALAPASTGFLPTHVYEGPELERAKDICSAINAFAMEGMGLGKADVAKVQDLSLREMLDALALVERWNDRPKTEGVPYTLSIVPDERLVAAVYTLVNFADLSPDGDEESDDIPVRFTQRRWGDEYVHFLLIGNRNKRDVEDGEDGA